jgi:hypothetical protein
MSLLSDRLSPSKPMVPKAMSVTLAALAAVLIGAKRRNLEQCYDGFRRRCVAEDRYSIGHGKYD